MAEELRFLVDEKNGEVTALFEQPKRAKALLILAHGAGAGMRHAFMESVSDELAARGVATLRYQFPYMEQGRRAPSARPTLLRTVRAAVDFANELEPRIPLFAGGKSMGGRMTSMAAAEEALPKVRGIVFFGFPLHAAGKPSTERADHLHHVPVPMLFLQGTRDKLAELELLEPICKDLGPRATLHIEEGADHSFHVPKRSGRSDGEVLAALADQVQAFT